MYRSRVFLVCMVILSLCVACTTAAPAATPAPTEVPAATAVPAPTTAPTEAPAVTAYPAPTTAPTEAPAATTVPTTTTTTGALRTPQEAALAAAGGKQIGGSVTVLATWGGSEQDSFMAMIKPFEDATGVQVQYEGTRDLNAVLTTRVQAGNPPDLAGLPGPGQMAQFAQAGKLVDLSTVLDVPTYKSQYAQTWLDLATTNGKLVGIFIKTSVKGLIWYDPKVWQAKGFKIPQTWDEMMALSQQMAASGTTPWSIGLENGAASGWPGTDWLEDIVLRQSGEQVYDQWWQGQIAWTSPQIKQAWQTWGQIVSDPKMVNGGANGMLTTAFGDSGNCLFANPPGCYMVHQASFITDFFTQANPGITATVDFDFFPFPPFTAGAPVSTEMAGDLFGMFNDTPQARALISYLTTPEAQAIWVQRGGAISPNKLVPLSLYPDDLSRKAAQLLVGSQVAVFDASDLMPSAMNDAFWKAILNYVQNPSSLDSILQGLDTVQKDSYK